MAEVRYSVNVVGQVPLDLGQRLAAFHALAVRAQQPRVEVMIDAKNTTITRRRSVPATGPATTAADD